MTAMLVVVVGWHDSLHYTAGASDVRTTITVKQMSERQQCLRNHSKSRLSVKRALPAGYWVTTVGASCIHVSKEAMSII